MRSDGNPNSSRQSIEVLMKNKELNYVCRWDKVREKSWSGTTYSLYKALEKDLTLHDCSIQYSWLESNVVKASKICFESGKLSKSNQFPLYLDNLNQRKLKRVVLNKAPTLQIGCFGYIENSYIYEDLAAYALAYVYEKDRASFDASNFSACNYASLQKKATRQLQIYEKNNVVFTMSNWVAEILKTKLTQAKVYTVGAGINIDRKEINYSYKQRNKFLFIGRDFFRKGGDLVVNAFLELSKKMDGIELYIAGPEEPLINTPSNVHWVGDVNSKELHYYYNLCDVFCMPSRFEAYGLVFSEALCFGLPCIGRNACEMPYFIEDGKTGKLLNTESVDDLSQLMEEVLTTELFYENVMSKKEYYINAYSWDAVAKRITNIIYKDSV